MDRILNINGEAETAYLAKYYSTEACEKVTTDVIAAMSFIEATDMVKKMAASEFHILSVEEIGIINIKQGALVRSGKWAEGLGKE